MPPSSEVAPGVHRLGTEFVNWYVIEVGDGIVAVDAGFPGYAKRLSDELAALGRTFADVRAVVLTHGDSDHTGQVPALTAAGAPVHLHPGDRELVGRPRPKKTEANPLGYLARHGATRRLFWHGAREGALRPPRIESFTPLADGGVVEGTGLRALHTPGHTDGHCVLHLADRGVLFAGDELCTRNPFTGRQGAQVMSRVANIDTGKVLAGLDRLEALEGELVLCGHGDPYRGSPAAAVAEARAAGPS